MSKKKSLKRIIRYLLELRFFPNLSMFLFQNELWLRIRPIKRFLKTVDPKKTKKIVDIGGGTGRIERLLNRTDIHIHDINEESIRIASETFTNTSVGNGDKLPFPDNHFDWAISIHTLEHVPKAKRENFILEMIRIAREGVFLNFPEGEYAELLCKNFLKSSEQRDIELNKWTIEHLEMGIPRASEVLPFFQTQNKFLFSYKHLRNYYAENYYWCKVRNSKFKILKNLMGPYSAIWKLCKINSKPTCEIIIFCTSTKEGLSKFNKAQ
jgi:ubiquinone/menaquinone biosynthesis C-methylase UbiE